MLNFKIKVSCNVFDVFNDNVFSFNLQGFEQIKQ